MDSTTDLSWAASCGSRVSSGLDAIPGDARTIRKRIDSSLDMGTLVMLASVVPHHSDRILPINNVAVSRELPKVNSSPAETVL
jgi:hypothetical protein